MAWVTCDFSYMKEFFTRMEKAAKGDFRDSLELYLNGIGAEFLRILEDEIVERKVMDTRLLLNSFHQGDGHNIWRITEGGLTLEVGTNVEYASYVNDGHWTCKKGEKSRFIPGDCVFGPDGHVVEFSYNPSAKTGITLKQKWIEGAHYWESALRILEQIYPKIAERMLQKWLDSYFTM